MAKKATLVDVSSGYASGTTLNNNFEALNEKLDNTLSRDGSTPNTMEADLDLNSNDLLNVKDLSMTGELTVDGIDFNDKVAQAAQSAVNSEASAVRAENAADNAEESAVEAALYDPTLRFDSFDDFIADTRTFTDGTTLVIPSIGAVYQAVSSGGDAGLTNGGGQQFIILSALDGQSFNVPSDGVTDAGTEIANVKSTAFSGGSRSDDEVTIGETSKVTYVASGVDLYDMGQLNLDGRWATDTDSDLIEVGYNSVIGYPVVIDVNHITTGTLRVSGVMNGDVHVGLAPAIELFADSGITGKKSNAYSYYHIGGVSDITINGVDSDGAGGSAPYINSNRFFTKRLEALTIKEGYPHNMNFFDGMGSDGITVNVEAGYSNFVEDGRWEVDSDFTFDEGTHNNVMVNAYYQFNDAYFRRIAEYKHTVTDNGHANELFEKLDAYYDQKELLSTHAHSKNFDVSFFDRGATTLTCRTNYKTFFDTGIVKLNNPLGFFIDCDTDVTGFLTPFLYCYDAAGALITTQPASEFIRLIDGGWYTSGDPLGLGHHFRTSAAKKLAALSVFPNSAPEVAFIRLVLRTAIVDGEDVNSIRVVMTEAKKYNTKCGIVTPKFKDTYVSPNGTTATSVPCTAGSFVAGDYVANTAITEIGTSPDKFRIVGWDRLTTGSGHVNNTDWRQVRAPTGN